MKTFLTGNFFIFSLHKSQKMKLFIQKRGLVNKKSAQKPIS